jgi:single-stranded-DNA-specific exonuclease
VIKNSAREAPAEFIEKLSLSPLTAGLLARRGVKTLTEAKLFLHGTAAENLSSPFLLRTMEEAVARLAEALRKKEKILIYGDYDVDGLTATALLLRTLRPWNNGNILYYIPKRLREGYGLHQENLAKAVKHGCRLVVTVDCGVTAHQEAEFLRSKGVDLLVTDHHEPGEVLPDAAAVVNPKTTPGYPGGELAGVGVAFKLLQGLAEIIPEVREVLWKNLDLVAVGTVADIVPLTGENRLLVKEGLKVLGKTENPGLSALLDLSGWAGREITPGMISFGLAPRLNACGRLGDPAKGLRLLLETDRNRARKSAAELEELNRKRQQIEEKVLKEAEEILSREEPGQAIVLGSENWHPGVIGIVASRLAERYYRPVVLVALEKGKGKGSARSIPGFHLYRALAACAPLLEKFGGHEMAAGLEVAGEKLTAFKESFAEVASSWLDPEEIGTPVLEIDEVTALEDLTVELAREMAALAPFGPGNPEPVLACQGVKLLSAGTVGKDGRHLSVKIGNGVVSRRGIGFNFGSWQEQLPVGEEFDFAFKLEEDDWNHHVCLVLRDIVPARSREGNRGKGAGN